MTARQEKINRLLLFINGKISKRDLKHKVLNLNLGRLSDNEPRFTFDNEPVSMEQVFRYIYAENIDYSVTKL